MTTSFKDREAPAVCGAQQAQPHEVSLDGIDAVSGGVSSAPAFIVRLDHWPFWYEPPPPAPGHMAPL